MTQNLKIEVLTGDISIDGMVVTNLVTKEELSTAIVKKADLGTDGKIPTSQLPAEIVNTAGIVDEVKLQLETSIKDAVDESNAYAESYTDNALSSKADLTSGKVPLEQLPAIDQYPQFGTALSNLSTSILTSVKQRTDELEKTKADLGEDGKVLREQIPSYDKISGLPEQLEVMSTQTAAVSGELDEHKLQMFDQIDTLKENIEANVQQLTDRQSHLMRTYATKELGVDAKVGVKPGEYFYVRSANEKEMLIEYQNVGGVATQSGKSYPSSSYVQEIADYTAMLFIDGKTYNSGDRVTLANGSLVMSTVQGNTNNPNENLSGWRVVGNFKRLDLSGYKLSKYSDITALLTYVLSLSVYNPIDVILPHGEFLLNATVQTPNESLGVILDLNGSVLRPTSNANLMHNYTGQRYILALASTTDHPAVIKNGVIDGVHRNQDLWDATEEDVNLNRTDGVAIVARHVSIDNVIIKNCYGVGLRVIRSTFIHMQGLKVLDCGGYFNDNFIGDGIYLEIGLPHQEKVDISLNGVSIHAKTKGANLSRTGITLEGFAGSVSTVNVNMDSCSIKNVQRVVHAELSQKTTINVKSSNLEGRVIFVGWGLDYVRAYLDSTNVLIYSGVYNQSFQGIAASIGNAPVSVFLNACRIRTAVGGNNTIGTWATVTMRDCYVHTVNRLGNHLNAKFYNCEVVREGAATVTWVVQSDLAFYDCVVRADNFCNIWDGVRKTWIVHNSTFYNLDIHEVSSNLETFKNNTLFVSADKVRDGCFWLYKDITTSAILQYPKYLWGVGRDIMESGLVGRKLFTSTGVSVLSPEIRGVLSRCGIVLCVMKGMQSASDPTLDSISRAGDWYGYSTVVLRYDSIADNIYIVGNVTYYGMLYEEGNKGVSLNADLTLKFGTFVTQADVCVLPLRFKDTLPYAHRDLYS